MALTFTSFSFDKPVYVTSDPITLTVAFVSDDVVAASTVASAVSVTLSDSAGAVTQTSDGTGTFPDLSVEFASAEVQPVTAEATDTRSPAGTWTASSVTFTGSSAPFAGTAVLTSVA